MNIFLFHDDENYSKIPSFVAVNKNQKIKVVETNQN